MTQRDTSKSGRVDIVVLNNTRKQKKLCYFLLSGKIIHMQIPQYLKEPVAGDIGEKQQPNVFFDKDRLIGNLHRRELFQHDLLCRSCRLLKPVVNRLTGIAAQAQIDDFQAMVCLEIIPGGAFGQHHQPNCQSFALHPLPRKCVPARRMLRCMNWRHTV